MSGGDDALGGLWKIAVEEQNSRLGKQRRRNLEVRGTGPALSAKPTLVLNHDDHFGNSNPPPPNAGEEEEYMGRRRRRRNYTQTSIPGGFRGLPPNPKVEVEVGDTTASTKSSRPSNTLIFSGRVNNPSPRGAWWRALLGTNGPEGQVVASTGYWKRQDAQPRRSGRSSGTVTSTSSSSPGGRAKIVKISLPEDRGGGGGGGGRKTQNPPRPATTKTRVVIGDDPVPGGVVMTTTKGSIKTLSAGNAAAAFLSTTVRLGRNKLARTTTGLVGTISSSEGSLPQSSSSSAVVAPTTGMRPLSDVFGRRLLKTAAKASLFLCPVFPLYYLFIRSRSSAFGTPNLLLGKISSDEIGQPHHYQHQPTPADQWCWSWLKLGCVGALAIPPWIAEGIVAMGYNQHYYPVSGANAGGGGSINSHHPSPSAGPVVGGKNRWLATSIARSPNAATSISVMLGCGWLVACSMALSKSQYCSLDILRSNQRMLEQQLLRERTTTILLRQAAEREREERGEEGGGSPSPTSTSSPPPVSALLRPTDMSLASEVVAVSARTESESVVLAGADRLAGAAVAVSTDSESALEHLTTKFRL